MIRVAAQIPQPTEPVQQIDLTQIFQWDDVVRDLMRVTIVLVLAFGGYRLLRILTSRLRREVAGEVDPQTKRMREQRGKTIADLLENVALVVIVLVAALTVLATFINIAPLLATVGILGLAISFGAQSLVKDIINGAFMLMEGQFGVGDVIRIGDTAGMVEKITLRTTVLRDVHGIVHVIPNGNISSVSNLTKTWSRAVLEIPVAYKEDVDRVIAVLLDIGQELYHDPEWGVLLLEEPVVPGVESFGDSGVVIRLMAKTLPLKQWDTARELRRRIKKRFDAEGIEIPFPHTTFYWGQNQMPPSLRGQGDGDAGASEEAGERPEARERSEAAVGGDAEERGEAPPEGAQLAASPEDGVMRTPRGR